MAVPAIPHCSLALFIPSSLALFCSQCHIMPSTRTLSKSTGLGVRKSRSYFYFCELPVWTWPCHLTSLDFKSNANQRKAAILISMSSEVNTKAKRSTCDFEKHWKWRKAKFIKKGKHSQFVCTSLPRIFKSKTDRIVGNVHKILSTLVIDLLVFDSTSQLGYFHIYVYRRFEQQNQKTCSNSCM